MSDSLYLKLMLAGTTPGFPYPMVAVGVIFPFATVELKSTRANP